MSNQTFSIWDGSIASSFGGGTGTEANPYLINSAAQLAYLAEVFNDPNVQKNKNTYYGKYYKLTSNIDLDKREWNPIGYGGVPDYHNCTIVFDGDNHIVRGLFIDRPEDNDVGLFGILRQSSIIKNLTIENGFVSGNKYVGGILGRIYARSEHPDCEFENCIFSGEVHGNDYSGGIVGLSHYGRFKDCINSGMITCTYGGGGVAGSCWGDGNLVNCINTGTVTGDNYIGGIVGLVVRVDYNFNYCRNSGNVSGTLNYVGGISGSGGCFEYCANSGNVSGTLDCVGGISGTGVNFEYCTNSGDIWGGWRNFRQAFRPLY